MLTAIVAAVLIQVLLAVLLFGSDRLDRADTMAWMARHPLVRHRHQGESARALALRQTELERLGAATRRAAGGTR